MKLRFMVNDMTFMPLVTIIIPVYNGANFLSEAIDSALAQDYKNLEIIVVNDGSTDDGATEQIALSYGNKIKYYSKPNGGVSSALNYAIKLAEGEYISWLSHDDLYYPDKISKEIEFLNYIISVKPDENPELVVIHSATESIDCDGKIIKIPSYRGVDEFENNLKVIIDNVYQYRLSGCSFLIPKAAFSTLGGFREDIRTVSDVEYWYRLLFHDYHFYCLTKRRLVKNRSHGKQVGKTKEDLFTKELNELHISIADELLSRDVYNSKAIVEKYYLGLIKRDLRVAANYVKNKGIDSYSYSIYDRLILTIKRLAWVIRGKMVAFARTVYRRVFVK